MALMDGTSSVDLHRGLNREAILQTAQEDLTASTP